MAKNIAIIAAAALGCAVALHPTQGFAKTEPVYTGTFSNVAVSGYDPVAYFTNGKPVNRVTYATIDAISFVVTGKSATIPAGTELLARTGER